MAPKHLIKLIRLLAEVGLMLLLGSCRSTQPEQQPPTPNFPAPTLNSLFYTVPTVTRKPYGITTTPTLTRVTGNYTLLQSTSSPSPFPSPTGAQTPTVTATSTPDYTPTPDFQRVVVYNEGISPNWVAKYSTQMRYNDRDATIAHDGKYSLSFTPVAGFGNLLLSVRQTSNEIYERKETIGLHFWLYTGEKEVANSDLIISILGSNRFPFWIEFDHSVESDRQPIFPETRLYFLDINQTIPPQTWIPIEIWLDDLLDEPDYTYVTAIQIKNDENFLNKLYIDQVELLMTPSWK